MFMLCSSLCMYVYAHVYEEICRAQKRMSEPLKLELGGCKPFNMVLGTKLRSSGESTEHG